MNDKTTSEKKGERASFTRGRRVAIGLNVLIVSLLAPMVGGLLLYLLFRPELRHRIDVTSRASFTLSERTQKVLDDLAKREEPIDVYTCFRPDSVNEAGNYVPGLDAVEALIGTHCNDVLREFEVNARGKLRLHLYDPSLSGHLQRIDELGKRIGEPAANVCVVEGGQRLRLLKLKDLAEYDQGASTTQSMQRPGLSGFRDEESLAQAILAVAESKAPRIAFLRGHGERSPAAVGVDAAGSGGFAHFTSSLHAQNYEIASIALVEGQPIPREGELRIDILAIAEPTKQLAAHELETIVRFAKEGGALFVLLHPDSTTSLDFALLQQLFGLNRSVNPVCQETTFERWQSKADIFETDLYSDHPIVKPLRSRHLRTHWENASAYTVLGGGDKNDVELWPLVWTGNKAWLDLPVANGRPGEKRNLQFDPGAETQGPQFLGYAARLKAGGRAVFFGSAGLFDDRVLQSAPNNRDLGLNSVDWLAEREQLISIAPRAYDEVRVDLTPAEFSTLFVYVVLGVPALSLLLGIVVYWMRRN